MCVRVDAIGMGRCKNTHISVGTYIMKGDNDDSLTWPFTGTVMIDSEFLNQLEDENHHKMITFLANYKNGARVEDDKLGIGRDYLMFISHTNLDYQPDENCQYVEDNTLVVRVDVEVTDYKPWLEPTI